MKYALLIYAAEKDRDQRLPERIDDEYPVHTMDLKKSDRTRSCEPLEPATTATTIPVRGGTMIPKDGPFADTEGLGSGGPASAARPPR